MAIATAIQHGAFIRVYDEGGRLLTTISGDALVGYTGTSFSVRVGNFIRVYDEKGRLLSTQSC